MTVERTLRLIQQAAGESADELRLVDIATVRVDAEEQ